MATERKNQKVLDTSHATRGVWLVKVPNYLSESWKKASESQELGKMRISKKTNPALVQFILAPDLLQITVGESGQIVDLPTEHRVNIQEAKSQCMSVFTEDLKTANTWMVNLKSFSRNSHTFHHIDLSIGGEAGEVVVQGKVVQRADIQPVDSTVYMSLKKHQIQEAEKTKFTASHLSELPVHSYKPKAYHKEHEAIEKRRKELKKARVEKSVVLDLLFSAFRHHQYYTFKDLVDITQQPQTYLKEILREVCVYNTKTPHKYTWQLKPEYSISNSTSTNS